MQMIKLHSYEVDYMTLVIEARFKNKKITNLHNLLLELCISNKYIYEALLKIVPYELIDEIIAANFSDIKEITINFLKKRGLIDESKLSK